MRIRLKIKSIIVYERKVTMKKLNRKVRFEENTIIALGTYGNSGTFYRQPRNESPSDSNEAIINYYAYNWISVEESI